MWTRSAFNPKYNWGGDAFSAETRQLALHCRQDLSAFITRVGSFTVLPITGLRKFQCMLSFCDLIAAGSSAKRGAGS